MKNILLVLFLGCFINVFSQTLEGTIFIKGTEIPLQSANVYLDGTTIATTTNDQGYFKIDSRGNTKSDLVISYIGYLTTRISNPFQHTKIKTYLEEDSIAIEEVFIGQGPFSRKEMMEVFYDQFLGSSKAAKSCKILNEDDINLYFDVDANTLSASSRNPIIIKNSYLEYDINFDLVDFVVEFRSRSLNHHHMLKSYFSGTTFYKDISKKMRADKKRLDAYMGSSTHLMQTIANESWEKEKFVLIVDKFRVNPKEYFSVSDTLGVKKVKVIKNAVKKSSKSKAVVINIGSDSAKARNPFNDEKTYFNILFKGEKQSLVDFLAVEYYVDDNGNYAPFYDVMFGGYIGSLKAGDMLPSDYFQTIKEHQ